MHKNILNIGIAGYGYSAKTFHIPFIMCNVHYNIKKVYSRNENLKEIEDLNCQVVHCFEDLLCDDIDIILICTPNTEHFWMAEKALKNRKHVIVEKPITVSSADAFQLKKLSQENNVLISAFQNRRLDGGFLTAKKIINDNRLGEILDYESHFDRYVVGRNRKAWKNVKTAGVNILYDLGVHLVDQVYSLFGMPKEIYADFRKQRDETPDFDNFEIKLYYNDLKATVSASETITEKGPHIVVHGKRGSYIKYGMDVQEEALKKGETPNENRWGEDSPENYGSLCIWETNSLVRRNVKTEAGNYGIYYDNFYHSVNHECELLVGINQSIDVLKIIEASIRSNTEKKRIAMNTFSIDRERVFKEFEKFVEEFDSSDPRISLKKEHTLRVAALCNEIAESLCLTPSEIDLAWLIGMLHDIGRFEQIVRYDSLEDAKTIKHADLSVQILFVNGLLEKFCNIDAKDEEYEIIKQAVLYHSDYKLPDDLDDRTLLFSNIIRDADKIDILKVVYESDPQIIYGVSKSELMNQMISENVSQCFFEKHAVLRSLRKRPVDNIVGYASFVYELVFDKSKKIVDEQGFIWKILDFYSNINEVNKMMEELKRKLHQYLEIDFCS